VSEGSPVTVSSAVGQLTLPATADRHVGRGTVVLAANLPGAEVNRLLVAGSPITDVRVEPAGQTGPTIAAAGPREASPDRGGSLGPSDPLPGGGAR